jgi:hypothetical protein
LDAELNDFTADTELRFGAPKPPPAAATGIVTPKGVAMLGTLDVFNTMSNILEP